MSEQIIEQSYVEELPVLTPQQKAEVISKHVRHVLRDDDIDRTLSVDVGFALRNMWTKKRYYPTKEEVKVLAPFVIGEVTCESEMIAYVYSFLVTTCEPVDFTTLPVEQCVKNVLDLEIPNLDQTHLAQLVIKIYEYFTEQETNKMVDLKQRMLDFDGFEGFPYERWDEYEAQLVKIAFCLYSVEERDLKDFGLTATSDWKRFFIDYYKLKQVPRYDFYDCYHEVVDKIEREIEFNELEVYGEDNFEISKVLDEYKKNGIAKARSNAGKSKKRNHTTPIRLRNLHTGRCVTFEDITQCYTYLKVSRNTIQKMKRGEKTMLDNDWQVVQINDK